jgi:hypothetical protein
MTTRDTARTWRSHSRRGPIDDAYTLWFNAQSRCAHALHAWNEAAPEARAAAYRAYLVELGLEELAADELERLHVSAAA